MSRSPRITEPSPKVMTQIRTARAAVASQRRRVLQCHWCKHNSIVVYEDARGHIQAKCKVCGKENLYDLLNMRRLYHRLRFYM